MSKFYIGNTLVVDPDIKLEKVELTQAEYDALTTKEDNILYLITDAVNPLEKLSDTVDQHLQNISDGLNHIPSGGAENQILVYQSEGKAKWSNLTDLPLPIEDLMSYGVSWKPGVADPELTRVGNTAYHKTLPIQSQMRGCVYDCLDKKVVYWLDEHDWRWAAEKTVLERRVEEEQPFMSVTMESIEDLPLCVKIKTIASFEIPQNISLRPKVDDLRDIVCKVNWTVENMSEIDHYLLPVDNDEEKINRLTDWVNSGGGTLDQWEFGSDLSGNDGEVMVYTPPFYIKSWDEPNRREVRISAIKIDDSWEYQEPLFVGAYRDALWNSPVEDLSSYVGRVGSLIVSPDGTVNDLASFSIVTNNVDFRGGDNDNAYDVDEDIFRRNLGKPRTDITRETFRQYARNAGKELMSYKQYKNIMYWLYVIEYANFNSQAPYTDELTAEGCHQGGLGDGITNLEDWSYNDVNPICPNGYTNDLGNGTGIKLIEPLGPAPVGGVYANRWRGIENPFGDILTNLDGIVIQANADDLNHGVNGVYTTDNPDNYGDDITIMTRVGSEVQAGGYTMEWDLGHAAHIIPRSIGGDTTQYKCDYHWVPVDQDNPYTLVVGGGALSGAGAGLGYFYSDDGVSGSHSYVGFRSVSSVS